MEGVRINNVVLWGGPRDGDELASHKQLTYLLIGGDRYVRTNRISARRLVYRYEGRRGGEDAG